MFQGTTMFRLLLVASTLATAALSQSQSPAPECKGNSNTTSNFGNGTRACKVGGLTIIQRSPGDMAAMNPQCYTFAKDSDYHRTIDNTCMTVFPSLSTLGDWTLYESIVYCDGSYELHTYTIRSFPDGNTTWASPRKTETDRVIGYAGCGTFVYYRCGDTGDIAAPMSFGMGPVPENGTAPLDNVCLERARQIIEDADLPQKDELWRFPYKLPVRCVFQEICLPNDNSLYDQQGGKCLAYEKAMNACY